MSHQPSPLELSLLSYLFRRAADAGYGVWDGRVFEAYPGMEDAAADYMESLLGDDD